MRLAIVGAGAIGGTIGAHLVRAGHDVTFVDADVDHVAAIRTVGLRIEGPIDAFHIDAPVALARQISPEPFDGFDPSAFMPGVPEEVTMRSLDQMVAFNRRSAKIHSGVWRDLAVRKRRTEVDAQLGTIPCLAAEVGLTTPLVARIVEMIHEVEDGERTRSLDNLRELDGVRRRGADEVSS